MALGSPCGKVLIMKVFDLGCTQGHVFEGWFASEADFAQQRERGLITCPLCGDASIDKRLSAPRLNLKGGLPPSDSASGSPSDTQVASAGPDAPEIAALQAAYMHMVRHVVANTEDVGQRFVSEARAMHAGDLPQRPIRGQASAEEAQALVEEGVELARLVIPDFAKQPLQ